MDGKTLTSHPAQFASLGAQPALSAALEELQAAQASQPAEANQAAHASLFAAAPTTVTPAVQQALSGVSARELLDELRTGRLAVERAFLERARTTLAETAPPEAPPVFSAPMAQPQTPQVFQEVAPTAAPEAATPAPIEPVPVESVPVESLAVAPVAVAATEPEKHLIFALGELRYAVPLDHVVEIAELEQYTPVPNVPDWILGITNLRGDILSLVDLNALFGESTGEVPRGSSLLVAQTNAGDLTTCLVVDRVYGVVNVTPDQVQKLDQVANHTLAQHTRGYVHHAGDLLSLLNLEGLLRAFELHAAA